MSDWIKGMIVGGLVANLGWLVVTFATMPTDDQYTMNFDARIHFDEGKCAMYVDNLEIARVSGSFIDPNGEYYVDFHYCHDFKGMRNDIAVNFTSRYDDPNDVALADPNNLFRRTVLEWRGGEDMN